MTTTRRKFLQRAGGLLAVSGLPTITLAEQHSDTKPRLIVALLRGGMDGLAAVPVYGESSYRKLRGNLALENSGSEGGVLKLDGLFGLHPKLSNLYELYNQRELIVVHAASTPYRERSHFDGQNVLENGSAQPNGRPSGWLNRALPFLPASTADKAIALGQNVPLVLRGDARVSTWAPSRLPDADFDTITRIAELYANDPLLSERLEQALDADDILGRSGSLPMTRGRRGRGIQNEVLEAAGKFLNATEGPRIAVFDIGGWDTHANQGAANGGLANRLGNLDKGIGLLKSTLGTSWANTIVLVVTEFGRTVSVNGTGGTDHGTGSAAFVLGGAVDGGRILADWPGLSARNLHEGRDLKPTLDLRGVFKTVLRDHLGVDERALDTTVFPNSRAIAYHDNLIRV